MNSAWATCKKEGKLVKFGGGFYCGLVEMSGKKPIYVFNGFFMTMRSAFTAPGRSIHYYTVEWDESNLSWEDFRGKVLGDWKALGLKSEPNVGDNGVHASASPFEAMA